MKRNDCRTTYEILEDLNRSSREWAEIGVFMMVSVSLLLLALWVLE